MNLLAASGAWVLDVVFFALIALGTLFGVWRGFLKGICKLAGTIFAVGFAFFFCFPMKNSLESTFGLTTALENALGSATAAGWIAVAISFVSLVIIIKLGAWIVGKIGTSIIDRFAPLRTVNRFLGGLLGIAKALLIILIILAIFRWINVASINEFIASSSVVGKIYDSSWFITAFRLP